MFLDPLHRVVLSQEGITLPNLAPVQSGNLDQSNLATLTM